MMNHGIINKFYYQYKISNVDVYDAYPELNILKKYFARVNRRDKYYIAMKYHALTVAKSINPDLSLSKLTDIINGTGHLAALYYLTSYVTMPDHNRFINNNFNKFVNAGIYPITPKSQKDKKYYGSFKPVPFDQFDAENILNRPIIKQTRKKNKLCRTGAITT